MRCLTCRSQEEAGHFLTWGHIAATTPLDFDHRLVCGCLAWQAGLHSGIDYCRLHTAVTDLLASLRDTLDAALGAYDGHSEVGKTQVISNARALVRKIDGTASPRTLRPSSFPSSCGPSPRGRGSPRSAWYLLHWLSAP